jgi:CubicO group peptidase (beta-lactamase class C family)
MNLRLYGLVTVLLLASSSQTIADASRSGTGAEGIDDLVNEYVVNRNFAGSVLVAKDGEILLARGYGLADPERNIQNTPDTKFMIGSITKQFTAMLVTQLVEKGTLRLDDTISKFLPEFPKDIGDRITIEMLLLHTSGLRLPEGIEAYYHASRKEQYLETFVEQLSVSGLHFDPGTGYRYSNAGYHILGLIIEKVTGKTYDEVLAEQILEPLGMSDTGCNRTGAVIEDRAISYHRLPGRIVTWSPEHSFDPGIVWFGSGFLYSTALDLLKFSEALSGNALLSDEYRSLYLEMRNEKSRPPIPNIPEKLVSRLFGACGNGFVGEVSIVDDPDTGEPSTFYWHDGTMYLFKSYHYHFADEGLFIIVLSNSSQRTEGDEMVLRIRELLSDRPYDHIRIKRSLWQYLEEDIATHAGFEAAMGEYLRLRADTLDFVIPPPSRMRRMELEQVFLEQGMDAMVNVARELKSRAPSEIDEGTLNSIGYEMLKHGYVEDAVETFRLNVEFYPDYANGYDSLGEAYMLHGEKALAIENYKKSLALDPGNENAVEMLKGLAEMD